MRDQAFIRDRITAVKAQIVAYEEAILALAGNVQSYKLDTGQTVQTVTNFDLPALNKTLDSLYNRCTVLENRLDGGGAFIMGPNW